MKRQIIRQNSLGLVSLGIFFMMSSAANAMPTLLQAESVPPLKQDIYVKIDRIITKGMPDGAIGANVRYEEGKGDFFIEGQHYGADYIQSGVAQNDINQINYGIKSINWGFSKQGQDGSFPGTGDPFHSTSIFVEAAARVALLLNQYDKAQYGALVEQYKPKIKAAAQWLAQPANRRINDEHNKPYTHRRYIWAAAMAMSAQLTGDNSLREVAREYVQDGLALQWANGVNPEKGGYDVSYQTLGTLEAERYLIADPDSPLRDQVLTMISKSLDWELTHISPSGEIDLGDSTRTSLEVGRSGKKKTMDMFAGIQAFVIGYQLTGNQRYLDAANLVARAPK